MLIVCQKGCKVGWHGLEIVAHQYPSLFSGKAQYCRIGFSSQASRGDGVKLDQGLATAQTLNDFGFEVFISLEVNTITHEADA